MDTALTTATYLLQARLSEAASSGLLGNAAADAFGFLSVPEGLWELQQAWSAGQFKEFPSIQLSSAAAMAEARGAYVSQTGSILINQDWLKVATPSELVAVLAEEVGHHLDARFNVVDTPGDEGELFSRLLLGQQPSTVERERIRQENDAIQVTLADGHTAWAEAADPLDPVVRITGSAQAETLEGRNNNDTLFGMDGADKLYGNLGNDYLDGGNGADTMIGDVGDDIYIVDNKSDLVIESVNEGKDSVLSTVSFALPDNVENLDLRTTSEASGAGNDLDNVIYGGFGASHLTGGLGNDSLYGRGNNQDHLEGGAGNDYLDGGQGNDLLEGGLGDDTYVVRDSGDQIIENEQAGNDWVYTTVSYALSDNVENIQLFGSSDGLEVVGNLQNNTLIGDQWSNKLSGGAGNDYLNGGAGNDQMYGGTGNDTYVVDSEGDTVSELSGEGTDWVVSTASFTLSDNVEHLDLRGSSDLTGFGNGLDNIIKGNLGNTTLHGGAGNDSLYGRGSGSDTLFGDDGNDYLDGGQGADTLVGGDGDDTFVVDNSGDQVIEAEKGGSDWVISDISYSLGADLEGLRLRGATGSEDLDGNGNDQNNTIYGNSGRNIINGGGGGDIINGGAGSDTLFGGSGTDLFVLASKEADGSIAMDHIGDFQTGQDILYISRSALNLDTSKFGSGILKASDFKFVNANTEGGLEGDNGLASTAAFVFDQSSGILYHNSNGSESGAGDNPSGILDLANADLKASDIQLF
jgi:Ca2+-binding RTX toxin-like protein